jgi:hypothetical protein
MGLGERVFHVDFLLADCAARVTLIHLARLPQCIAGEK